jgi:hypothetical protein
VNKLLFPILLASLALLSACGDSLNVVIDDTGGLPDEQDSGSASDDASQEDGGADDSGPDQDDGGDTGVSDGGKKDGGKADGGGKDGGSPDGGAGDGGFTGFCRSWNVCPGDQLCDFALGRCERRATWKETSLELFSYRPPAGASGDMLVIDGKNFSAFAIAVKIGGATAPFFQFDENRILAKIPSGASGTVSVTSYGSTVSFTDPFDSAQGGVIACDGTTPDATGADGDQLGETGRYAAGYVDFHDINARLYYPAECGSIRRPAVKGSFPFVALLHGNGAVYIDYEYLGGLLATWGYVSFMTFSEQKQEYDPVITKQIYDVVSTFRGKDLSTLHPALDGLSASSKMLFVGHSRGCMRSQNVLKDFADVKADTVGSVFLGPADEDYVMPGPFLVIGASLDMDSLPYLTDVAYNRQSKPRWKVMVQGGNHGMFCDHRVYSIDRQPTLTRRNQLGVVISFALPLIQRAFGLSEPFAAQLDNPPSSAYYTATADP